MLILINIYLENRLYNIIHYKLHTNGYNDGLYPSFVIKLLNIAQLLYHCVCLLYILNEVKIFQ